MSIKLTATGIQENQKRFAVNLAPAIQDGAKAIAAAIQHELAPYPAPSRRRQPPKSPAQRRAVFALIAAGRIPYSRTGQLGQRWNIRPTTMGAVLENRRAKAALVYGRRNRPGDQAAYHKGTWPTVDKGVDRVMRGPANELMAAAIERVIVK